MESFSGISDPYEPPAIADRVHDAAGMPSEEAPQHIILLLERKGCNGARA